MKLKYLYKGVGLVIAAIIASGCYDPTQKASLDSRVLSGTVEYAPQMYHSEPYDPMSQVVDTSAGLQYWPFEKVGTSDSLDGQPHGEWYNSNYFNEYGMNMRTPPANTVRYNSYTPLNVPKDDYVAAAEILENPYSQNEGGYVSEFNKVTKKECKEYYARFCSHCHGDKGEGDGLVGEIYGGVANLMRPDLISAADGHIYYVITNGKGRMAQHASQVEPLERWMIVNYVRELQK
jgi:hypothetical protein